MHMERTHFLYNLITYTKHERLGNQLTPQTPVVGAGAVVEDYRVVQWGSHVQSWRKGH